MERLAEIPNTFEKDSCYQNTCLLILYTPEERLVRSVTGRKSKNSKMLNPLKLPMTPEKLKFIYGMLDLLYL